MKRVIILLAGISMALTGLAQVDSTRQEQEGDTIRIGNMIIIKKPGNERRGDERRVVRSYRRRTYKPSAISTNWGIVDLGFANFNDQTDYNGAAANSFAPGLVKDNFKLRTIKSSNVNVWVFMQRLNVIKNIVNLKYGLGIEMNNYRFKEPVVFNTNPTLVTLDNSTNYKKNKLAADYATIPMMINFNFTPHRKRGFGISAGASVGYLYNSRQKTITDANGKQKERDDFDLRPWKISYIGELSLGPVKLYGSYANQSMFEKGLDMTPYAIGVRLSNW